MKDIAQNEFKTNDLYDIIRGVDVEFGHIFEGGGGVKVLGDIVPFDDADVFADLCVGWETFDHYRARLERTSGVEYHDLFKMNRKSFEDLLASLPDSAVEEILRNVRDMEAALRAAGQALAAGIKERASKITFGHGDGLSRECFVDSWRILCADYTSFRHLMPDLQEDGWLNNNEAILRWRELKEEVVKAMLAVRDCFDWDQLASQRSEGQSPISWPLGTIDEERLKEAKTLVTQVQSMWNSLRSELFREVDEHFEFSLAEDLDPARCPTCGN